MKKSQLKSGKEISVGSLNVGDCTERLKLVDASSIDLVYFDPPFFTQRRHTLANRANTKTYSFDDKFDSLEEYLAIIERTLVESKRILKDTGSVFLHCDRTASHHLRLLLDKVFGPENFQSEIVWSYKRWSNAKKGLLNAHQIIFFYSKSTDFKFNTTYTNYSSTTNVDQILQARSRGQNGKAVYKRDDQGQVVIGKPKQGVPLSDTWEIPYLNPKAKERTGYPTQKPVLLLNQIINIVTDEGDVVLDPFCGSGTTCVAAKLLKRHYIGIDISAEAIELAYKRLDEMVVTSSSLLQKGEDDYFEKTDEEMQILNSLNAIPVQRNQGIDGFLRTYHQDKPVPVKIQGPDEALDQAIQKLQKASFGHDYRLKLVVQTSDRKDTKLFVIDSDVQVIKSMAYQLTESQLSGTLDGLTKSA